MLGALNSCGGADGDPSPPSMVLELRKVQGLVVDSAPVVPWMDIVDGA